MRPTNLLARASSLLLAFTFSLLSIYAQDTKAPSEPRGGTAPRSSADKYHAHAKNERVSVGAELLTPKQVSKEFAADVNRCCLVVRVAVYPDKDEILDVSRDDFILIAAESDTPVRPESSAVIAAKLEKESRSGVMTNTGAGVGYESGTYVDPITGQLVHVHGVTTTTEAGVAVGSASTADRDREVMERELSEKALPEAKIAVPVSGYLYFSIPKPKKDTKFRLEYLVKGEKLTLPLP